MQMYLKDVGGISMYSKESAMIARDPAQAGWLTLWVSAVEIAMLSLTNVGGVRWLLETQLWALSLHPWLGTALLSGVWVRVTQNGNQLQGVVVSSTSKAVFYAKYSSLSIVHLVCTSIPICFQHWNCVDQRLVHRKTSILLSTVAQRQTPINPKNWSTLLLRKANWRPNPLMKRRQWLSRLKLTQKRQRVKLLREKESKSGQPPLRTVLRRSLILWPLLRMMLRRSLAPCPIRVSCPNQLDGH